MIKNKLVNRGITFAVIILFIGISVPSTGNISKVSPVCKSNNPPYVPSNPIPPDGASNMSICPPNLSWAGGDPDGDNVTYDVYFGLCGEDPLLVTENVNNTWYQIPFLLEFETCYVWMIVAEDEHGLNTSGPLWYFQTQENLPPCEPSDPFPGDGASFPSVNITLCWNGCDPNPCDTVTYDVYLGGCPPYNKVSSNQTGPCYEATGLELFKKYYWRIVAWDSGGLSTSGPIWRFKTGNNSPPDAPTIDGPRRIEVGVEYEFTFSTEDPDGDNVSFYVEWGDGTSTGWTDYVASGTEIKLMHSWPEGTYTLMAKAKDVWGYESDWTEWWFSKNQQTWNMWFLRFLERFSLLEPNKEQIKAIIGDVRSIHYFVENKPLLLQLVKNVESFDQYQVTDRGYHPALAKDNIGTLFAAYEYSEDRLENYVYWTYSTDGGMNWSPGVYYAAEGNYPTVDYWGSGSRFIGAYGTFNTHDTNIILLDCTDPTDVNEYHFYNILLWDWIYDLTDLHLAADNSQGEEAWGIISFIASRQTPHLVDVPHLFGPGEELYYLPVEHCAHTSVDIDHNTYCTYAPFDYYDPDEEKWNIFVWIKDFSDWDADGTVVYINSDYSYQYPAVAAYDDNVVILAETDENGNKDITCIYSDHGLNTAQISIITTDVWDERYPEVSHVADSMFICTFQKSGNLYASVTHDGGATWNEPRIVADDIGSGYKSADLCETDSHIIFEGADEAIYIAEVSNPPGIPTIDGQTRGKAGVEYEYTFNAVDSDDDDVYYWIIWDDGCPAVEWIGPYPSGTDVKVNHTFEQKGTYIISAKAKDIYDAEGKWGYLEVKMPFNQHSNNWWFMRWLDKFPLLQRLLGWFIW